MNKQKYLLYLLLAVGIFFCITPLLDFLSFRKYPAQSFLEDSGVFANFLAPFFPIAFVLLVSTPKPISKILFRLPVIILLVTILLTNSRTGLIAVIVSAIYILTKYYPAIYSRILSDLTTIIIIVFLAIVAFSFLFYYKPDSAKGRILIYSVTMNMISDKPLSGHGFHSFKKEYLNYQGKYFEKHPDSNLSLYADDTKFAFNEYLQVAAEFGFIGLMTLALILFYCFSLPVDTSCQSTVIALKASLISICCLSMFSYPLRNTYTFSEVLITILLLCSLDKRTTLSIKLFSILLLVAILAFTLQSRSKELLAQKFITTQINSGSNLKQKLILFSNYYPEFKNNSSFLASYGLNLSRDRQFEKSNHFFTESLKYMNDINIRMLIGCNFQQMKNYKEAENKYIDASNMIPCRFVPLYQLADLYKETGDTVKLLQVAKKIVDKPIKIPSYTVTRIKQEMEDVLHTYTK